jgi:hypothetical protein
MCTFERGNLAGKATAKIHPRSRTDDLPVQGISKLLNSLAIPGAPLSSPEVHDWDKVSRRGRKRVRLDYPKRLGTPDLDR